MSILDQISDKPKILPPRIVVHSKGGVGKTTFGASVPGVLMLPVEEGLGVLQVAHLPSPSDFGEIMEAITALHDQKHSHRALCIDTIDHVEPLLWARVCQTENVRNGQAKKRYENIEDFGYGKGYVYADRLWIEFFHALDALRRDRLMTIIVLSHNESRVVEDPIHGPYERISPKLHKRGNALLHEWADVVGYLDIERSIRELEGARGRKMRVAAETGRRFLLLEDQGGFVAKNRYGLPVRIEIPRKGSYQVLRLEIVKALGIKLEPKDQPAPSEEPPKEKIA